MHGGRPSLYVVLEGGPGVGKSTLSEIVKELLEQRGLRTCVVRDSSRSIARILGRLYGEWWRAPRELIEYMILGHQLHGIEACREQGADIIVLDYGVEAPLAYMEADGIEYPRELDSLAEAVLNDAPVAVFVLERPVAYATDEVRWEDVRRAQRYSRLLVRRALSLVERLGAVAFAIPEKPEPRQRAEKIVELILWALEGYEAQLVRTQQH
jgi:thymidylate kinase